MAFKQNRSASNAEAQPSNESWKAQGFLNLYLPTKNGTRRKLGSIPLKEARPSEATLLAWLNEDPSRVATILERLEMDYQPAAGREDNGFDLPE
jgi:hypothetical protein